MPGAYAKLIALALAAASAPPADAPGEAARLLALFRQTSTLRAHFREEKRLAILAVPLVSSGDVYFSAPDRLVREVTDPAPSTVVIDGDHISFREGGYVQALPLAQSPIARSFVDSLLEILSGDLSGLARTYALRLAGQARGNWSLALSPRSVPLSNWLESIDLSGHGATVDRMAIREKSGDETLTTFSSVVRNRPMPAAEQRRFDAAAPGRSR